MNTERIWEIFERVRKAAIDYIVEVFGLEAEEVIGKILFVPMIPLDEKPVLLDDGKYHLPLGQCRTRKDLTTSSIFLNMKEMMEENYSFDLMVGVCVHEIVHAIINHFRITPEIFSEATLIRLVHFCGGRAYGSNSAREGEWSEAICEYLCYKRANMGKMPLIPALEGTINRLIYGMKHPCRVVRTAANSSYAAAMEIALDYLSDIFGDIIAVRLSYIDIIVSEKIHDGNSAFSCAHLFDNSIEIKAGLDTMNMAFMLVREYTRFIISMCKFNACGLFRWQEAELTAYCYGKQYGAQSVAAGNRCEGLCEYMSFRFVHDIRGDRSQLKYYEAEITRLGKYI